MSFLTENDEFLEKCYKVWDKFNKVIKKGFDREPVYNDKCLETKIKSYKWKTNTN